MSLVVTRSGLFFSCKENKCVLLFKNMNSHRFVWVSHLKVTLRTCIPTSKIILQYKSENFEMIMQHKEVPEGIDFSDIKFSKQCFFFLSFFIDICCICLNSNALKIFEGFKTYCTCYLSLPSDLAYYFESFGSFSTFKHWHYLIKQFYKMPLP